MAKLKLHDLEDDKPVRLTVELSGAAHRLLCDYAAALGRERGRDTEPAKLVPAIVERFIRSDRVFMRRRVQS